MSDPRCAGCGTSLGEWDVAPIEPVGAETCPGCGHGGLVPIVYGYPGPDLKLSSELGLAVWGGCVVSSGAPRQACRYCGIKVRHADGEWLVAEGRDSRGPRMVPLLYKTFPLASNLARRFEEAMWQLGGRTVVATVTELDHLLPGMLVGAGWWTRVEGIDATCSNECLNRVRYSGVGLASYEFASGMLLSRGRREPDGTPYLVRIYHEIDRAGMLVLFERGRIEVLARADFVPDVMSEAFAEHFGIV